MDVRALLDLLVPRPRKIEARTGLFALRDPLELRAPPGLASPALEKLRSELEDQQLALGPGMRAIEVVLDPLSGHPREGYQLDIDPDGMRIVASAIVGLNHGIRTLTQLVRHAPRPPGFSRPFVRVLPALSIVDAPVFERRGVMLDVSRDRVPRMDYLFRLVEKLAEWKVNELQLYFEHAFAYHEHELVWRGVDPFTHDEIRALDAHCAAHGIELVPNQQSFGHLHHWLKHERYRHLAEVPEGIVHPFLGAGETQPEPFSLCPTDPRSLEFLAGLYDELLPCFTSGDFNVGLDETIDLGPGRSVAAIREKGVGRIYLQFLRSVHELVSARGKRMQFWADILLNHPELVPDVPEDAVALLWGYEADHPFEEQTRTLADAGVPFYVCPGTSSWLSIGGRLHNMLANVESAARWGAARGARGLLITDWGDRGHLQPPCVSWPGLMAAAGLAWNPEASFGAGTAYSRVLQSRLTHHLLPDTLALELQMLGELPGHLAHGGLRVRNASPLFLLLTRLEGSFPPPELAGLTTDRLSGIQGCAPDAKHRIKFGLIHWPEVDMEVVERELSWAAGLLRFACELGIARLRSGGGSLASIADRGSLAEELRPLIAEHRSLWLERSRPGGLDRSARWLERILAALTAR